MQMQAKEETENGVTKTVKNYLTLAQTLIMASVPELQFGTAADKKEKGNVAMKKRDEITRRVIINVEILRESEKIIKIFLDPKEKTAIGENHKIDPERKNQEVYV